MNIRIFALATAALIAAAGPTLAFDPSAEYSVHSLSQTQQTAPAADVRALGVPSETAAIGGQMNDGFAIDPSSEYASSTYWQPKGR